MDHGDAATDVRSLRLFIVWHRDTPITSSLFQNNMANREELLVIRAARAGLASAQLALGKRYLFGGAGLPKSETTALYWLDRAARQNEAEAWRLIGSHIPFEAANRSAQPAQLYVWYERAFDAGVMQAGLVLAKLVLAQTDGVAPDLLRRKAWMALEAVAHAGIGEAQWLMAQLIGQSSAHPVASASAENTVRALINAGDAFSVSPDGPAVAAGHAFQSPILKLPAAGRAQQAVLDWTTRAAGGGVTRAQHALAEHAWQAGDQAGFLQWGLPLARQALAKRRAPGSAAADRSEPSSDDIGLFARCAQIMLRQGGDLDAAELERLLDAAASGGDESSCLSLGLWYARMDANGARLPGARGLANYRKALRWLSLAGEQGLASAWYASSRIYMKPEFSQRNLSDAQVFVHKAAEAGHAEAQMELGMTAWRARRGDPKRDIEASYWLAKAAATGHPAAQQILAKVIDAPSCTEWARSVRDTLSREQISAAALLVSRLELAIEFGLSRAEALLLRIGHADCGHCLVIDIREVHPRSKRRLALVHTNEQRHLLNRIVRQFEDVESRPQGEEGNYRQRLYRLRMLSKPD